MVIGVVGVTLSYKYRVNSGDTKGIHIKYGSLVTNIQE